MAILANQAGVAIPMAAPIGGSYPYNYYNQSLYSASAGFSNPWGSGQYVNGYNANPFTGSYAGTSDYGDSYGSANSEFYPQSFPLFAGVDTNSQFYDSTIAPSMGPITNVPTYAPHSDSPSEFYDTMIGPAVQDSTEIYNNWENGPTESPSGNDEMNYFQDSLDHNTSEASSVYNQHMPEDNNKKALDILTANDNEALKKIDTMGKGGDPDNKVSSKDLQAAVEKYPDQFTEEQMWAIKWMYQDHGALWDWINGSDSKATFDEIHEAKNSGDLANH